MEIQISINLIAAFNSKCRGFGFKPCDPGPDVAAWKVEHDGQRAIARLKGSGWIRFVIFNQENECSSLPIEGSTFTHGSFRLPDLNSLVNKIAIHGGLGSFVDLLSRIAQLKKERDGRGIPVKIY